jgi:hypothetical protein
MNQFTFALSLWSVMLVASAPAAASGAVAAGTVSSGAVASGATSPGVVSAAVSDAAGAPVAPAVSVGKAQQDGFTPMAVKKSGSGVGLAFRIEGTPTVGVPLTIHIQLSSRVDAQATLRTDTGLQLLSDPVLNTPAGAPSEHVVTVVPQAEGRFYLSVFTSAQSRASASAIAVQVGKGAVQLESAGKAQVTPSGERVKSMPSSQQ